MENDKSQITRHQKLERGQNPKPTSGWGWSLSDYEVRYVRKYGVRPLREGSSKANREFEERLDIEATALLGDRKRLHLPTQIRTEVALLLFLPFFLSAGYFTFVAVQTFSEAAQIVGDAEDKESRIHE